MLFSIEFCILHAEKCVYKVFFYIVGAHITR